jgi:mono/diheme cytochrome c family protein
MMIVLGAAGASAQSASPSRGEALARANCAACHAIGARGDSATPGATPFRDIHRHYPVEQLAEALAEGISTGHEDMPEFQFEEAQIADIIAYLRTLER